MGHTVRVGDTELETPEKVRPQFASCSTGLPPRLPWLPFVSLSRSRSILRRFPRPLRPTAASPHPRRPESGAPWFRLLHSMAWRTERIPLREGERGEAGKGKEGGPPNGNSRNGLKRRRGREGGRERGMDGGREGETEGGREGVRE